MIVKQKVLSKKALAEQQGISRSSLYYRLKQPQKDWRLKNRIESVLKDNPSYGHRRIALAMRANKKRVLRVMKIFGIKPYRRRGKRFKKTKDSSRIYPNLLQQMPFPETSNVVWVSDFTEIPFHGRTIYLATAMDIYDRKVVGWNLLTAHSSQLTLTTLIDAVEKHGRPKIMHSDQGSEYTSKIYTGFSESLGIKLSMSTKASPWENGYQEAFYSQFKVDLGDPNRYKTLGELAVAVYLQIYYYNNQRIHTELKMPPAIYAERQKSLTLNNQLTIR
jgi:transposase InsO family protein